MKIGFFDSGLGGLTILKAVAKELPEFDYYFYGDTEHLPYGDRSEEEVYRFTKIGIEYLFVKDCSLIIVACNTASAETLRRLQTELLIENHQHRRILGVIIPTVEALCKSGIEHALLLATKRTIESKKYDTELKKLAKISLKLTSKSTPDLVPLIELGDINTAAEIAISAINALPEKPKAAVLACTHYTEIKDNLREYLGESATVFSQDEIIPRSLKNYLNNHPEITQNLTKNSERVIHLTVHKPNYDRIIRHLLGGKMIDE